MKQKQTNEEGQSDDGEGAREFFDALGKVKSELRPDGPPVNYEALTLFLAEQLDEGQSRIVWDHIVTYRSWYEAWREDLDLMLRGENPNGDSDEDAT